MRTKGLWTITLTMFLVPVMSTLLGSGLAAQSAGPQPGPRMMLSGLERLQSLADETVDVSLDTSLLALAARFMDDGDAEEAAAKAMVSGLKGVYVRSYEFKDDGAFGPADVDRIRQQLAGPGWSRMAGVRSKKESADVDIYLWMDGAKIGGLGILATEPRRFTVVNIVGAIDLDQLRKLEGFGLPKLDLEKEKTKDDKPKAGSKPKDKPTKPGTPEGEGDNPGEGDREP